MFYKNIGIDIKGDIDNIRYVVTDIIDKKPFSMLKESYDSFEKALSDLKTHEGEIFDYLKKKDYTESEAMGSACETRETHPSYCTASFSRVKHGAGGTALFNSAIRHQDTIVLRIAEAEVERSLHKDWIHPRKKVIEVEFSNSQFVDLITHLNDGVGTAGTILWRQGSGSIPYPKFVSKKRQLSEEFAAKTKRTEQTISELESEFKDLLSNKKLPKKDREKIEGLLMRLRYDNGSNMAFLEKSWQEQVDKTTSEAKIEIEAFWDRKLHDIALEAIGKSGINVVEGNNDNPVALEEL